MRELGGASNLTHWVADVVVKESNVRELMDQKEDVVRGNKAV